MRVILVLVFAMNTSNKLILNEPAMIECLRQNGIVLHAMEGRELFAVSLVLEMCHKDIEGI